MKSSNFVGQTLAIELNKTSKLACRGLYYNYFFLIQAEQNSLKCGNIQEKLLVLFSKKLPNSPDPVTMNTSSSATALYKNYGSELVNKTIEMAGCIVDIPPGLLSDTDTPYIFSVGLELVLYADA